MKELTEAIAEQVYRCIAPLGDNLDRIERGRFLRSLSERSLTIAAEVIGIIPWQALSTPDPADQAEEQSANQEGTHGKHKPTGSAAGNRSRGASRSR